VEKAIMAPNVATATRKPEAGHVADQLMTVLREVRNAVVARAEDVGARFTEEARKIHYGEADSRAIRGTASCEEVRELRGEGIEVVAVPPLPEDAN
jgi:hypothetical protein